MSNAVPTNSPVICPNWCTSEHPAEHWTEGAVFHVAGDASTPVLLPASPSGWDLTDKIIEVTVEMFHAAEGGCSKPAAIYLHGDTDVHLDRAGAHALAGVLLAAAARLGEIETAA